MAGKRAILQLADPSMSRQSSHWFAILRRFMQAKTIFQPYQVSFHSSSKTIQTKFPLDDLKSKAG